VLSHVVLAPRNAIATQRTTTTAVSALRFVAAASRHAANCSPQWASGPEPAPNTAISFTEAPIDAGSAPSIGSIGDALGNARIESAIGSKAEQLEHPDRTRACSGRAEVERETASWVHWCNSTMRRQASTEPGAVHQLAALRWLPNAELGAASRQSRAA
jgi:hypothetical protein